MLTYLTVAFLFCFVLFAVCDYFAVVDAGDILFILITPERFIKIWQKDG